MVPLLNVVSKQLANTKWSTGYYEAEAAGSGHLSWLLGGGRTGLVVSETRRSPSLPTAAPSKSHESAIVISLARSRPFPYNSQGCGIRGKVKVHHVFPTLMVKGR